jgi:O-antigen ligase
MSYLTALFADRHNWDIPSRPLNFFAGMCVLMLAIMGTSVSHVASTSFALLVLSGLFTMKHWKQTWIDLAKEEKWMLYGFALYALSGFISYINVQDVSEYIKDIERYFRFLLAIPIYLFLKSYRIDVIRYLYAGVLLSGPFLLAVALYAYFENPNMPSRGHYHHIIFGSLAMLNVGVMLAIMLTKKLSNLARIAISVSILCAFTAAILSQSRGVWLAAPAYLVIVLYMIWRHSKKGAVFTLLAIGVIASVAALSPVGGIVEKRITEAVDEVTSFYKEDSYATSVGARLAMWKIAIDVWKENPMLGTGPGDFDDEVVALQNKGEYVGMEIHASTHNIYVQALVNTGLFGIFVLLFSIFVQPVRMLYSSRYNDRTTSLSGLTVLLLFAVVGFSESWILRLPVISVYIIYILVIVSSLSATGHVVDDKRSHDLTKDKATV